MFMSGLLVTLLMLLLGACSPGHVAANKNGALDVWQYTGCHVVSQSPVPGSRVYAIGPFGDLGPGARVYFKQESADGTAPMVTGRPCE